MSDIKKELTQEEKVGMEDLAKELKRLPAEERIVIYHMIRGANLLRVKSPSQSEMAI